MIFLIGCSGLKSQNLHNLKNNTSAYSSHAHGSSSFEGVDSNYGYNNNHLIITEDSPVANFEGRVLNMRGL